MLLVFVLFIETSRMNKEREIKMVDDCEIAK